MKVNVRYKFKDLTGKVIKDPEGNPFELKTVINNVLLALDPPQASGRSAEQTSGDEKARRYMLAVKVYGAKDFVELSVEDVAMIKDLIGKTQAPLVVGQAYEVLEGKHKIVEEKK